MKRLLTLICFSVLFVSGLRAQFFSQVTNTGCFGTCTGSAQILPQGNYHYQWSNGDTVSFALNLCPGTYQCFIYNANYATLDSVFVVITTAAPISVSTNVTPAHCTASDGSVTLSASGGTPPYTYSWMTGSTTPIQTGLSTGTYSVTVADAGGCYTTAFATVLQQYPTVSIDSLRLPGCNACDGAAYVNVSGGVQPLRYLWNGFDTAAVPTGLCAGVNTVVVTDAQNICPPASLTFVLSNSSGMLATATNTNVTCTHPLDTTVVTVTGGSTLLDFYWGDGSTPDIGVTSPRSHTYAGYGIYTIQVVNTTGCAFFLFDTVRNNGVVVTIDSLNNPACNNLHAGRLVARATSGTAPYTYVWNTPATNDTLAGIAAGNYSVTVTDQSGCTASATTSLGQSSFEPGFYVYEQTNPDNCNQANGSAASFVYGGLPPYTYLWNTTPPSTDSSIHGLAQGPYNVTVTDAHGCQSLGFGTVGTQCVSHITGTIFHDLNNNCVQDSGEGPINGTVIISGRSGTYYGTTYSGTSYSIDVTDTGTYTLSAVIYNNYCNSLVPCGSSSYTVTILHQGDSSTGNNFAFQGASGFDLALHPGWTSVSPGFTKEYWVMGFNQSPVAFTGAATIVFTYDSNLIYQSSYAPLPVHDPAAHTLTWQVAHLPSPNFDWNGRFRNFFTVPATMSPGYLMYSSFSISPTSGDCDSSNNVLTFSETCYGSHDPNDKKVEPSGAITESDSILTYTIDFQNTGTAATNFIIIKDTLSPNLDPASVVNIASSHPYSKFDISGRGILTWTFNPLALPDSLADPDGSKGFVKFTIRKKRDLAVGATISNTASIYFDYNGAVVTNTVADTLTNPLSIIERSSDPMVHVTAYPNPFSDMTTIVVSGLNESYGFELYDMTGRLVQSIPSMNVGEFKIHRDGMAGGVYLYRITTRTHQYAYGKLIAK